MPKRWRDSREYSQWKEACLVRDQHRCRVTGLETNLEVHHLCHATYFPGMRYEVSNGISLHRVIHRWFHSWNGGNRKKCDLDTWKRFLYEMERHKRYSKVIEDIKESNINENE